MAKHEEHLRLDTKNTLMLNEITVLAKDTPKTYQILSTHMEIQRTL
jgi:hypothetical protein